MHNQGVVSNRVSQTLSGTANIPLGQAQTERLWSPIRLEKICNFEQINDIKYIVSKILLKRDRKRKMILISYYKKCR